MGRPRSGVRFRSFGGSGGATRADGGETAQPHRVRAESDNPDHVQDWERLRPYDRVRENGHVIRVETDGMGGLREIVETHTGDKVWGDTRDTWQTMRAMAPSPEEASRRYSGDFYAARHARFQHILELLEEHGPMTCREVASRIDLMYERINYDLRTLQGRGYVEQEDGRRYDGTVGPPKIVWRATGRELDAKPATCSRVVGRDYRRQVLTYMKKHGEGTTSDVADATGVPLERARKWLQRMVAAGTVVELGGWPITYGYKNGRTP